MVMQRKDFIQKGLGGGLLALLASGIDSTLKAAKGFADSKYRGIEGVYSPTNTHMVGNGFKVMNFFPNGKGFEERMSPFFLLDFNHQQKRWRI